MGELFSYSIPLYMKNSLVTTEIILCPWEGRELLKSNTKLGSLFRFQTTRSMKLISTSCMLSFCIEGYNKRSLLLRSLSEIC